MTKRLSLLSFCLLSLAGPAHAHGLIESSDPEAGRSVGKAPKSVTIDFTEDPAFGSRYEVIDGCDNVVGGTASIEGARVTIPISGGQDGSWRVKVRVISAQDGHAIKDTFGFDVGDPPSPCVDGPATIPPGTTAAPPPSEVVAGDDDEGSGFPVIPVAIGAVVLLGAGFGLRSMTGHRGP